MNTNQSQAPICQCCAMPMQKQEDFGNNADKSKNSEYCRYCYQNGRFTVNMSLEEFIEKQIQIAQEKLGMPEEKARRMAQTILPTLKRWSK
jgi:hypothetical protein